MISLCLYMTSSLDSSLSDRYFLTIKTALVEFTILATAFCLNRALCDK